MQRYIEKPNRQNYLRENLPSLAFLPLFGLRQSAATRMLGGLPAKVGGAFEQFKMNGVAENVIASERRERGNLNRRSDGCGAFLDRHAPDGSRGDVLKVAQALCMLHVKFFPCPCLTGNLQWSHVRGRHAVPASVKNRIPDLAKEVEYPQQPNELTSFLNR